MRDELGRVLAVDDDPDMLRFFSIALQGAGLKVDLAASGAEGLAKLKEVRPDLILCDVRMPQMNGYDFCREVRKSGAADIPFLFCSTLGTLPMRMEGLRIGADDYLVKPVSVQELQFRVQSLLLREHKLKGFQRAAEDNLCEPVILTATLGAVSLTDVLQLHAFQDRDCLTFHLMNGERGEGEVVMTAREVLHASLLPHRGPKAFFRLLAWHEGTVTVTCGQRPEGADDVRGLGNWLLDGAVQIDECKLLRGRLMAEGGRFKPKAEMRPSEPLLEAALAETLALVARHEDLDAILDASPDPDAEILRRLSGLLASGMIESAGRD